MNLDDDQLGPGNYLRKYQNFSQIQTEVQKPSNPDSYGPLSESFRIYALDIFTLLYTGIIYI